MSVVEPQQQAPGESKAPSIPPINTGTNNPFRRGTGSPAPSPGITGSPARRPDSSRNPFLDDMEPAAAPKPTASPQRPVPTRPVRSPTETEGLLANMSLEDGEPEGEPKRPPMRNGPPGRPRSRDQGPKRDIFADPPPGRRPPPGYRLRRNSDTSIADRKSMDEEEAKRRERRRRERAQGPQRDAQGRPIPSKDQRPKRPSRRLDVIDKLDGTSIFGTGLFHHDGPFDACNPHRNRKGASRAPMNAFAKDSLNNSLGGAGPLNKSIDLDRIHGHQEDSFKDFNAPLVREPNHGGFEQYIPGGQTRQAVRDGVDRNQFDSGAKVERVHGDESLGLGTSTFLEGAPAARAAIQRRESEGDAATAPNGFAPGGAGLGRKKSLVQRIRAINAGASNRPRGNSGANGSGALISPELRTSSPSDPAGGSNSASAGPSSAGGLSKINERNPFFQDYDAAYAKKGASIRVEEQKTAAAAAVETPPADAEGSGRLTPADAAKTSSESAPYELKRSVTEGGSVVRQEEEPKMGGGGFLNRVKSLRSGGRGKGRPERVER